MTHRLVFLLLYYIALIAVVLTGRKKASTDDYVIASRNLGVWATVSTLFSTYRNASGFVALVTLGVVFGLGAIWLTFGMLLSLVYLCIILPRIKTLADRWKLLTIPDYYDRVYGQGSALLVAVLIVIMGLIFTIAQIYVSGNVLVNLVPISFPVAVFLVGIPIGIYLIFRGYISVVQTDMFQWLVILLFASVPLTLIGRSQIDVEFASVLSPTWKGIVGFTVSGFFVTLMGADTWQRLYSARDVRTGRIALSITGPSFFVFNAVIVLFGIMLGATLEGVSPNQVFYAGIKNVLSPIASALMLTVLFASVMSTIDSYVFVNSLTFVKNLLPRMTRRGMRIREETKVVILIYLLLAMVLALFAGSFLNLVFGATTILTIMAPSAVYSFYRHRENKGKDRAAVLSMMCGVIVYVPLFLLEKFSIPLYLIFPLLAATVGLLLGFLVFRNNSQSSSIIAE